MYNWLIEYDFIVRAGLVGIVISIVAGPMGAVMIWRRMAYFGDTIAHATLLGIGIAFMLNVNIYLGLIGVCLLVAITLAGFSKQSQLANDTILGILSYTTLALGLIVVTCLKDVRVDLLGYLYGDILTVSSADIYWVTSISIVVLLVLMKLWRWLLSISIHENLAQVEDVPVEMVKYVFTIMIALMFAITIKVVGVLLMTALFIIPAASARRFAKTPEQMAILGSLFGCIAVMLGLMLSLFLDWPTGPAIVVVAAMIFSLTFVVGIIWQT